MQCYSSSGNIWKHSNFIAYNIIEIGLQFRSIHLFEYWNFSEILTFEEYYFRWSFMCTNFLGFFSTAKSLFLIVYYFLCEMRLISLHEYSNVYHLKIYIAVRNYFPMYAFLKLSSKPFISHNLVVKITIYKHTIDKFIQRTKILWAI